MSKVADIRRANVRALIGERGGLSALSLKLGYKNPSFLSQMTGPDPTREITEKTARKIESALGLGVGSLDAPGGQPRPVQAPAQGGAVDEGLVKFVADTIRTIGTACEAEGVAPAPSKFSEIVALVLSDTMERGAARPERVQQLVRLLK